MNYHILLDVDGVLIRDVQILNKVKNNVVKYVAKNAKIDKYVAIKLNNRLYKNHGHTEIGLMKENYKNYDIKEFCKNVYNDDVLNDLYNIKITEEINNIVNTLEFLKLQGISVSLFSNAPEIWCDVLIKSYHIKDLITDIYACDNINYCGKLKPEKTIYDFIEKKLINAETHRLMFIDDTIINLQPVLKKYHWMPILFDPNSNNKKDITHDDIPIMKDISKLKNLFTDYKMI